MVFDVWSLGLGVWNWELLAWALSFSKFEMRPPSLDLRKPEDGLLEIFLRFVQIRMYLAHPRFTPEEVATGLGAQEPPAGLIELFDHERRVHVVPSHFFQRAV